MKPIRFFDAVLTAPKAYVSGTHRTRSPAATLQDYQRFMPEMGITRLANITGLDSIGLPVYTGIRPNARSLATSQGKGVDHDSARASALMECIEFWHAEHIERPLRHDTYARLRRRARVLELERLPRRVGRRLHVDQPMTWIEGFDLLGGEPTWVPFELVSLCWTSPHGATLPVARSTTGLASGNHLLEAIAHALAEVIERDAEARVGETFLARPVSLEGTGEPALQAVLDLLDRAGVAVAAFEATSDIAVPVYVSYIQERPDSGRWRSLGAYEGWGCHLSPVIAASRAVTEAVQSRLTFIAGSRDDMFQSDYHLMLNEEANRDLWRRLVEEVDPPAALAGRVSRATASFEGDVRLMLDEVEAGGVTQVVAVDLGQPEIGIPVVKLLAPGMSEPGDEYELGSRSAR